MGISKQLWIFWKECLAHYITASIASTFNKSAIHSMYKKRRKYVLEFAMYYPKYNRHNTTDIRKQWI